MEVLFNDIPSPLLLWSLYFGIALYDANPSRAFDGASYSYKVQSENRGVVRHGLLIIDGSGVSYSEVGDQAARFHVPCDEFIPGCLFPSTGGGYEAMVRSVRSALNLPFQPDERALNINQVFFADPPKPTSRVFVAKLNPSSVGVWRLLFRRSQDCCSPQKGSNRKTLLDENSLQELQVGGTVIHHRDIASHLPSTSRTFPTSASAVTGFSKVAIAPKILAASNRAPCRYPEITRILR